MDFLIFDFVFSAIGWLFLWVKFRNKKKIEIALINEYNGKYKLAGKAIMLNSVGITLGILIGGFLIVVLSRSIYDVCN